MKIYAKVIGVVALVIVLVFGSWGIVKLFSNSNEGVALFNLNETKKDPQIIYDEQGRSMRILIEKHCIDSHRNYCEILERKLTELKEWIKENEFSECAIVKMAENNCEKTNTLKCDDNSCSIPNDQKSKTDITKFSFWFQDYFYVTKQNFEAVNNSIHIKRYTCIKRKSSWKDGICIKNLMLVRGVHDDALKFDFVLNYLAKNLKNYTQLPQRIAELIDFNNLTDGTHIYSKYGKQIDSDPYTDIFVLPSKPTVTKETVSWMKHDQDLSRAICNSFGIRTLTKDEIYALPEKYPDMRCFHLEYKHNRFNFYFWAFDDHAGTDIHYIEVMDNERLMFASKHKSVIYAKDTALVTEIPNGWIKIHENVFLKKNGHRKVCTPNIECKEFEENKEFDEFIKTHIVILDCKRDTDSNHFSRIAGYYLYSK